MSIRGPEKFQKNLNTNDQSEVQFQVKTPGTYRFHVYVEENKADRDDDDKYELIHHHAILMLTLPLKK